MKLLDTKGLKFKVWVYFVLFAVGIMVVLWLFQIMFLGTYYEGMKKREVENTGNFLVSIYDEEGFEEELMQAAFSSGLYIDLCDSNGMSLRQTLWNPPRMGGNNAKEAVEQAAAQVNGVACYVQKEPRFRGNMVIYAAQLEKTEGQQVFLYMDAPLAPVDATTQVLKNQLLIVSALSLLLSFFISYFIARRIARPITQLTGAAEELAKGDYQVDFPQGNYTEIRHLSDALRYATGELSKTDGLRRDLIANVSHDLKTPLTIIKSYAEMIRDISGADQTKRNAHTGVIIEETDRLTALVNDLLDLSKLEAGTLRLQSERVDLSAMVEEIMGRFQVLEQSGYTFQVDCAPGIYVMADRGRLQQVVYNLVSNAVNYTGADKRVQVRLFMEEGKARFEVTDTGGGIDQEEQGRIWDRYYKSSQNASRLAQGTGVGLAIVKNILEASGAQYGVISQKGQGSTFWFAI